MDGFFFNLPTLDNLRNFCLSQRQKCFELFSFESPCRFSTLVPYGSDAYESCN
jgi:hypothetical protein